MHHFLKRFGITVVALFFSLWAAFMPARVATAGGPAILGDASGVAKGITLGDSTGAQEAGKLNIAVLDFSPENVSSGEAVVVSSFIRDAFVRNGQYTVVDKGSMEKILAEQAFQQTGCTNQECAVKMGKLLNVHKMVVGRYSVMGTVRFLTASLVDVETGSIERVGKVKGFDVSNADEAASELATQMTTSSPAPVGKTPEPKPVEPEPKPPVQIPTAPEPAVREQLVKHGVDPRIAGGRVGIGLNFPGAGLRWFFADRWAVEASVQYEKTALTAGPRLYCYIASLGSLFPYIGIEGDYAQFKDEGTKGVGYMAGGFVGGEVYLYRRFSLQFDFGPVFVSLGERNITNISIQSGGIGFMANFGLTYYF